MKDLKRSIRLLYRGDSRRARRFRYGLIVFDTLTILYFIATAALPQGGITSIADIEQSVAEVVAAHADLGAAAVRSQQFAQFQVDAPACDSCGAITVRNGNCYLCHNCGNSMGCS